MDAIQQHFSSLEASKLAINAGSDILIEPVKLHLREDIDLMDQYIKDMVELAENGEIDNKRIDESVLRILKLKEERGMLAFNENDDVDSRIENAKSIVGSEENHQKEMEIIEKGITVVKNEDNTLPISLEDGNRALILYSNRVMSHDISVELALKRLGSQGIITDESPIDQKAYDTESDNDIVELAKDYDYLIVLTELRSEAELDPDAEEDKGYQARLMQALAKEYKNSSKKIIDISIHLPYDISEFSELSDAVVCCYNCKDCVMSADVEPEEGDSPSYCYNVPAAITAVFDGFDAKGTLPVDIPSIDENYHYTDKILYKAGSNSDNYYSKRNK